MRLFLGSSSDPRGKRGTPHQTRRSKEGEDTNLTDMLQICRPKLVKYARKVGASANVNASPLQCSQLAPGVWRRELFERPLIDQTARFRIESRLLLAHSVMRVICLASRAETKSGAEGLEALRVAVGAALAINVPGRFTCCGDKCVDGHW